MKHVLIAAGGTGGHVFPALAVAKEMKKRGWKVSWVGTHERLEARVVPEAGFDFYTLEQQGVRGKGLMGYVKAPFNIARAVRKASRLLASLDVEIVVGFGGYTAGPSGLAARLKNIPLVIHEQNAVPGLTNKLLARFSAKTLLGFERASRWLKKGRVTGNPVREEISALVAEDRKQPQEPINIFVVGGSLGAKYLNESVPKALANWQGVKVNVRHQCGAGNVEKVNAYYRQEAIDAEVSEFIDDMASAYRQADLVICRAGALTVAELACAGVASILVPFPFAVDDHQTENARVLEQAGAGTIVQQADVSPEQLGEIINRLISDTKQLRAAGINGRAVAKPQAAELIANICEQQAMESKDV